MKLTICDDVELQECQRVDTRRLVGALEEGLGEVVTTLNMMTGTMATTMTVLMTADTATGAVEEEFMSEAATIVEEIVMTEADTKTGVCATVVEVEEATMMTAEVAEATATGDTTMGDVVVVAVQGGAEEEVGGSTKRKRG